MSVDHCCIFGRIVHIWSAILLDMEKMRSTECERAIEAGRCDFLQRKANKPKSDQRALAAKNGPRIVKRR